MPTIDFGRFKQEETPKELKIEGINVSKIVSETGLIIDDIKKMVKDKKDELKGMINTEGALFLISKELGVDIKEEKEESTRKSPLTLVKERQKQSLAEQLGITNKSENVVESKTIAPPKASIEPQQTTSPQPKMKQNIPTFSMILNGKQGSGKSTEAYLFSKPFIIDFEHGKNTDMAPYSSFEQIRSLTSGTIKNLKNGESIDIIDIQQKDKEQLWEDLKYVFNWFIKEGHKKHDTLIIDTAFWLRDTRTTVEKKKKGKDKLDWFEYGPITEDIQETIYDLLRDIRDLKRNIIFITHWTNEYKTFKDEKGHPTSQVIGKVPDVKEWLLDAVTWIVNFEKPEESGYDGKFIVYLDKAPRHQYAKIDITSKSLFEIINNLETFDKEVEAFKNIDVIETEKGLEKLLNK